MAAPNPGLYDKGSRTRPFLGLSGASAISGHVADRRGPGQVRRNGPDLRNPDRAGCPEQASGL